MPSKCAKLTRPTADYIAIGPVFATASKAKPDPVIGLDGVRHARALTRKPLVAIGGITRANCRDQSRGQAWLCWRLRTQDR